MYLTAQYPTAIKTTLKYLCLALHHVGNRDCMFVAFAEYLLKTLTAGPRTSLMQVTPQSYPEESKTAFVTTAVACKVKHRASMLLW